MIFKVSRYMMFFMCLFYFEYAISQYESTYSNQADIYIEGDELYYIGEISDGSVLHTLRIIEQSGDNIKRLSINSVGGSIEGAIHLAYWVYENNIALTVDELCFSSCANYIIPSSPDVYIKKNSIVGWHGGATYNKHLNVGVMDDAKKEYWDYLSDKERIFFDEIGVDIKITGYPTIESQMDCMVNNRYFGWYYSEIHLKSMGLRDITYEGGISNEFNHNGHIMRLCLFSPK
ncbi:hypothetical protein N9R79_01940 [Vibrio sp.]|nr:hypothetical protein [Vibrio sp.]